MSNVRNEEGVQNLVHSQGLLGHVAACKSEHRQKVKDEAIVVAVCIHIDSLSPSLPKEASRSGQSMFPHWHLPQGGSLIGCFEPDVATLFNENTLEMFSQVAQIITQEPIKMQTRDLNLFLHTSETYDQKR